MGFSIYLAVTQLVATRKQLHYWTQKRLNGPKPGNRIVTKNLCSKLPLIARTYFHPRKVGTLINGRRDHGAIFDGEKFLVIGGDIGGNPVKNEVCTLSGSTMTCVEQSSSLDNYAYYPELFLVAEDFGKDLQNC